ncbi:MAG: hypothetical protein F4Z72_12910 [Gemmatimonadales bacterium]|nr:hypothetical protein [Candidatus Palauibacter irciniicola]
MLSAKEAHPPSRASGSPPHPARPSILARPSAIVREAGPRPPAGRGGRGPVGPRPPTPGGTGGAQI